MPQFKVVSLDHGYPTTEIEERIVTQAGGAYLNADRFPIEEAFRACEDADAILLRWRPIGADLLRRFHQCKIIVRYGVGTDNVDVVAATEAKIIVGHVPNYCFEEVSDHAIALLLGCIRQIVPLHRKLSEGGWDMNPSHKMWRTPGRTLGLIGFGHIAQAVARKMAGWNMKIIATDPFVDPARAESLSVELTSLENVCRRADYISLHVPLLPETRGLISSQQFSWMKPGIILVNTARGPVLDANALLAAIDHGVVASAGLDVFENEPLPKESPLRRHPKITVTDHIAWYSEESEAELRATAAEEAVRVALGGLPRSLANPEVLHRLGRFHEWTPNDTARWQLRRLEQLQKSAPD